MCAMPHGVCFQLAASDCISVRQHVCRCQWYGAMACAASTTRGSGSVDVGVTHLVACMEVWMKRRSNSVTTTCDYIFFMLYRCVSVPVPVCVQLTQELVLSRLMGVPTDSTAGSGLSSRRGQAAAGSQHGASATRSGAYQQPTGVCNDAVMMQS